MREGVLEGDQTVLKNWKLAELELDSMRYLSMYIKGVVVVPLGLLRV